MNWEKREIQQELVRELAERFQTDLITAAILYRRAVTEPDDLRYYVEDDLRFLHNPFLFKDMERVVERINRALAGNEMIFVYGDRDVDGITSITLLVEALREFGGRVAWDLPRGDDEYGLSLADIEKIAVAGTTLLISVDCGISNVKEIERAAGLGIDTIIVDHHNLHGEMPPAYAIINPKIDGCGYPFKDLAACGVALKLYWALQFSRTALFKQEICFLNIQPLNEVFLVEVLKVRNLVITQKINENIVPGIISWENSPAFKAVAGVRVLVYNEAMQRAQLKRIFSGDLAIELVDLQPVLTQAFPQFKGSSLLEIKTKSRMSKYLLKAYKEIDALFNLYLSYILKEQQLYGEKFLEKLELVALATLADIMPLKNENRILVKNGLRCMRTTKRKALRELLYKKNLYGKPLGTQDIVWQITPIINSSGRMGEAEKAAAFFLSSQDQEIEELAVYLCGLNRKRKSLIEKNWNLILHKARHSFEEFAEKFIIIWDENIHRGVTGLLATRLVNTFKVPSVVIALLNNRAVGSVRSHRDFAVKDFLLNFEELFNDFGGHDFAAGFNMPLENLQKFKQMAQSLLQDENTNQLNTKTLNIDAEIPASYLDVNLMEIVERLEPYGEGNPPLNFLTRHLLVCSCEAFGAAQSSHLKLLLDSGRYKWPAIFWNGVDTLGVEFNVLDQVDVVYRMGRKNFMNQETIQLVIQDIKKSS